MTINIKNILILSVTLFSAVQINWAQTGAPSAYTSFGVGRIENTGTVKYQAMGGAGIALPSEYAINGLNAASLTKVQEEQILIDLGIRANYTQYQHNTQSATGISGGLNNISLAFKLSKKITTAITLTQFSSVGYNILSSDYINGTSTKIAKNYIGKGGLDQFAWTNSFAVAKNLAVGAKLSYLFGKLSKTEQYSAEEIGGDLSLDYTDFLQQVYLQLGFQYQIPLNESKLFLGGTYSKHTSFKTNREVTTSSSSGAGIMEELDANPYEIPTDIGGGLGWTNKNGIKIALDYRFQNWDQIEYSNPLASYKDSHRFSGGIELRRRKSRKANPYVWQLGGYYEDSYIKVKGKGLIDRGITCGVGIPTRSNTSRINISFNYGKRGTMDNSLISENYYGISVSMSMVERWFQKQQFN